MHFHTHDTSGIAAASVLAAIEAGADAVDGAIDAMSGLTSQPNLGSIVEALRYGPRDPGIDPDHAAHDLGLLGAGAQALRAPSRATSAPAPPRSTCTACPAASTPICASRRARSASTTTRWPEVRAGLRRRQRHVWRHHQGDSDLEGGRRHGAADGDQRLDAASRCSTRTRRSRFPSRWCSCFAATSASLTAAFREAAAQDAEGRGAAHAAAGCELPPADLDGRARQDPAEAAAAGDGRGSGLLSDVSEGVARTMRADRAAVRRRRRSCRRRCSSMAWSRARRSASSSSAARR